MNSTTIRFRLLHAAAPQGGEPFACEEIALGLPGGIRSGAIDLLVVDARGMAPAALRLALATVGEWRMAGAFRRGVLVAPKPCLESVVLAIRAGLHEVVPAGVGALHLVRLVGREVSDRVQRRALMRRVLHLLRLGRVAPGAGARSPEQEHEAHLADEQRALEERQLAEREATLAQREQELRRTAARVQSDLDRANQACAMIELAGEMRAELEKRETELRLMARQYEAEGALPARTEEPTVVARRRELENLIQTQQLSLDRRERALATRERWLRDYELALTGRSVGCETN